MRRIPLWVWGYALLLAVITSLPYGVGAIQTPDDWQYSGAATSPDGAKVDYYSHMAKMVQGARGQFDYQLLFTHEDHTGLPSVQGFYVAIGAVAGIAQLDFGLVYHLVRFLLTFCMVIAIWTFMARYLQDVGERRIATFFATITFGWSWLLFFVAPEMTVQPEGNPIELWLLDAYNLLGAFIMPHFAASAILQIVAFLAFDRWLREPNIRDIVILTLSLGTLSIIQPYVVLMTFPIFGILTVYSVFILKRVTIQPVVVLMIPALVHGGIVVFQYVLIANDPIWADFTAQNQTLSPPPIYYLLGYMPLLIPIAMSLPYLKQRLSDDKLWLLPITWIVMVMVLIYAPFPTQRRYLLGVQTPLALLAGLGWYRLVLTRIVESWRPFANIPYLTLGILAFLAVLGVNTVALLNPSSATGVYYTADELSASQWIIDNTVQDDVILTTFDWDTTGSGGKVVSLTGRRVFAGHWIETAYFDMKHEQLMQFYNNNTDEGWRREFLTDVGVTVIWYDENAREFGQWQPETADYLELVFDSDSVQLFVPNIEDVDT